MRNQRWWMSIAFVIALVAVVLLFRGCGEDVVEQGADLSARQPAGKRRELPPRKAVPPSRASVGNRVEEWRNTRTEEVQKVRKVLRMEATPKMEETGGEMTVTVDIQAREEGEVFHAAKKRWEPMTPSEFGLWRGGAGDRHAATAKLVKQLDGKTGEPWVIRQEFVGDGAAASARNYSETESGIHLTLRWKDDDLEVEWQGADTERRVERVEIPFSKRFRSEGESGEGGDAGVD